MPDLTTPAGRDELRRTIDKLRLAACDPDGPVYGSDLVPWIDDVTTALLARLDQADAGAALAQRVIRAARLLGIANSDTEPNAAETEMLVDDILTHCADFADAGERLTLACEKLIERGGAGEDERWWKPWDDAVAEAEAAIAAFRSPPPPARAAEETTENRK